MKTVPHKEHDEGDYKRSYFEDSNMDYIKKQKDRLKRLNGYFDE
jgi:hypothetical protein